MLEASRDDGQVWHPAKVAVVEEMRRSPKSEVRELAATVEERDSFFISTGKNEFLYLKNLG